MENFDNVAKTLFDRLIAETEGLYKTGQMLVYSGELPISRFNTDNAQELPSKVGTIGFLFFPYAHTYTRNATTGKNEPGDEAPLIVIDLNSNEAPYDEWKIRITRINGNIKFMVKPGISRNDPRVRQPGPPLGISDGIVKQFVADNAQTFIDLIKQKFEEIIMNQKTTIDIADLIKTPEIIITRNEYGFPFDQSSWSEHLFHATMAMLCTAPKSFDYLCENTCHVVASAIHHDSCVWGRQSRLAVTQIKEDGQNAFAYSVECTPREYRLHDFDAILFKVTVRPWRSDWVLTLAGIRDGQLVYEKTYPYSYMMHTRVVTAFNTWRDTDLAEAWKKDHPEPPKPEPQETPEQPTVKEGYIARALRKIADWIDNK